MSQVDDERVAEFRANGGAVGGRFAGVALLLLTTTGARSGEPRTTPTRYYLRDDTVYVVAASAGSPRNPGWYHNLLAHPEAQIELVTARGVEHVSVLAEPATGEDRDRLFAEFAAANHTLAEHSHKTDRVIPVVALRRA